jgi:hypothetical protein
MTSPNYTMNVSSAAACSSSGKAALAAETMIEDDAIPHGRLG